MSKEAKPQEHHLVLAVLDKVLAHVGKMSKGQDKPKVPQLMKAAQEHNEHKKMGKKDLEDNLDEESEVVLPKPSKLKGTAMDRFAKSRS
jgi:hypothetical protein